MDTSTLAAIWAAIISTCAFFAYVLVEYPKITANWKALNKIAVEFSQKNRAMVKFFALLSFSALRSWLLSFWVYFFIKTINLNLWIGFCL